MLDKKKKHAYFIHTNATVPLWKMTEELKGN